jgi:hypothetical protein
MALSATQWLQGCRDQIYFINETIRTLALEVKHRNFEGTQEDEAMGAKADHDQPLNGHHQVFSQVIELLIQDIVAMRLEAGSFDLVTPVSEELKAKNASLQEEASLILEFCEAQLSLEDHLLVEKRIEEYMHDRAMLLLDQCYYELCNAEEGAMTIPGKEKEEYQKMHCHVDVPNMTFEEEQILKTRMQQLRLKSDSFSQVARSPQLTFLNQDIKSYELGSSNTAEPLDLILRKKKDHLLHLEVMGRKNLSKYLALAQFLKTVLSTHRQVLKNLLEKSLVRVTGMARNFESRYSEQGITDNGGLQQRIERLLNLKKEELQRVKAVKDSETLQFSF